MKYKTVLITGGAGFIGSNLCIYLKRKYPKLKVIALDNLKRRGSEYNIQRLKEEDITFLHADIRVREDLFLDDRIDLVLECSAEPSVLAGFNNNPEYIINTNLTGTINCLELARKHKADIIFLSTSRVYPYEAINDLSFQETKSRFEWREGKKIAGWSKKGIDIDFKLSGPKTLYGATKLASEMILTEYSKNYGLKSVVNRCGVIAGPWQFGKVDQGVFGFWMMAHYFKKRVKYIGFAGKGKQVRDLLHVQDLCKLIDLEIGILNKLNGRVYNVGGGRDFSLSLLETTQICSSITGNRIEIGKDNQTRPGDISIYLSDNTKIERDTGWKPSLKPEKTLLDIFDWINVNEKELKAIF